MWILLCCFLVSDDDNDNDDDNGERCLFVIIDVTCIVSYK